jgi:hypothetical protein
MNQALQSTDGSVELQGCSLFANRRRGNKIGVQEHLWADARFLQGCHQRAYEWVGVLKDCLWKGHNPLKVGERRLFDYGG